MDFFDRVRERAYFKYLERINHNLPDNAEQDWEDAKREETIQDRIRTEAFLHSQKGGDPITNWVAAENEIKYRIEFLAYYLHQNDITGSPSENIIEKTPFENWKEAEKIYIEKY